MGLIIKIVSSVMAEFGWGKNCGCQKSSSHPFVARSGMEDAISNGLLVARPFGGVSIAWLPDLNQSITPITNFRHKRIVGIELKTKDKNFIILCAYMPFFDTSNRVGCMAETTDAISMLETIIEQYPNHSIILGGDLNTELKGNLSFDPLWNEFMEKFDLSSCDSFYPSSSITYRHQTLEQQKFIDHFLVSRDIIETSIISNHEIVDEGHNLSDHLVIKMDLSISRGASFTLNNEQNSNSRPKIRWDKISDSKKEIYT